MKAKTIAIFISGFFISNCVFSQDTSQNQKQMQDRTYQPQATPLPNEYSTPQPHIYRDTRLGSSSPLYNTYKKNDYGAGAVTTNPNKTGGASFTPAQQQESGTSQPLDSVQNHPNSVTTNPQKH
jgi:PBP1b-binding outer membrane lipoprotein LpoB